MTRQPPKTPAGGNAVVAVSADGPRWIVGGGGGGGGTANVGLDHGDTWTAWAGLPAGLRVIADTVNPFKFYAMNLSGAFYASVDGGRTFTNFQVTHGGVFRSDETARTWVRINDDDHQWGLVLQITGDPRIYGRVYVGTHGRRTLYGDIPAAR